MRDKLIHHCFGVNFDIVWHVIQNDLPELMTAIDSMLNMAKEEERDIPNPTTD